jgi:hypothetical protein
VPAVASWATMVVRSAVVVGVIRDSGLGLNGDEARQNEQGKENSEQFNAFLPRGHGLAASTHTAR